MPGYVPIVRERSFRRDKVRWLPIPSNVGTSRDFGAAARFRKEVTTDPHSVVLGHFGTFGPVITLLLKEPLLRLLRRDPHRLLLLIGRGSQRFREVLVKQTPDLESRIFATGSLDDDQSAAALSSCDLLLQPYPDGATCRRGSLLAGLALGVPTVTNRGPFTESFWADSGAVALSPSLNAEDLAFASEQVLSDAQARGRIAEQCRRLYLARFDIDHSIATLRSA
jgi:glycosyltransferase involved in cell wall biosynthesis